MKKFVCPYCLGTHSLSTCNVKCSYDSPLGTSCVNGVVRDETGNIPDKRKAYCMRCKHARRSVFCPELGKELPMRCLTSEFLPIVLVGARGSGRSSYLAAAIRELRKSSAAFSLRIDTNAVAGTAEAYSRDYGGPLDNGITLKATATEGETLPLIYPVSFEKTRRDAVVSFYDTAGDGLCSEESVEINNRCLSAAGGIVLVLEGVISTITRQNGRRPGKPIDIPLAITFTRLDLLISHGIIDRDGAAAGEGSHMSKGAFACSDAEEVRRELSALAEEYFDDEMLAYLACFKRKEIFAVSALGSDPVKGRLISPVAPRRALDPLLWIFAEKGFVKKVK